MAKNDILLEAGTNELEIIEFYLDEELEEDGETNIYRGHYGVNVAKVLEITNLPSITEMPETPHPAVLGAFNQRSSIIPLIDLSMWLGKKVKRTGNEKVIITEFNTQVTAFLVSGVDRIHRLSWELVEAPNEYVSKVTSNSITSIVRMEDRVIFILDLEEIIFGLNPNVALKLNLSKDWKNDGHYTALIADDSNMIRSMLKELLQEAGFIVETCKNGEEAWDRLKAIKATAEKEGKIIPDYLQVVVSDIEMPRMDGLNLTKRIKEDHMLKELPVILFSSLITEHFRHKGESVGADDQVTKPEVGRLAMSAKELIEQYAQRRAG